MVIVYSIGLGGVAFIDPNDYDVEIPDSKCYLYTQKRKLSMYTFEIHVDKLSYDSTAVI